MYKVIIAALIFTVVGIIVFSAVENLSGAIVNGATVATLVDSDTITCTISGEVTRPGTYLLDIGATLYDLMSKASGVTSNADPLAFNTSYTCEDGMSFYIAPIYDNGDTCSVTPIEKTNINTAAKAELMNIPGFGDAISTSLISYRSSNGDFMRLEDIKNVTGIGDATFSKAKDYMTLKAA